MQPTRSMLAVAEKLARYITEIDRPVPNDLFAREIVIVENFAPFIFRDKAVWAQKMRDHLTDVSDLKCQFGAPIDYSRSGDTVYFSLPTSWSGNSRNGSFSERGGWGIVLKAEADDWRVAGYGWAVIETTTQ